MVSSVSQALAPELKVHLDKLLRGTYEAGWMAHMFAVENGRTLDECFAYYMKVLEKAPK